ncbi:MAG: hypothetical protein WCJ94_03595 [bacterium]
MKKIILNMEIDIITEKALKKFCKENKMSVEKFVEEAIFEKLEAEEMQKYSFLTEDTDDSADTDIFGITPFDSDRDSNKKKH